MTFPPSPSSDRAILRTRLLRQFLGAALLLTAITAPLWQLHSINREMPPNKADMIAVWKGAQAALHGRNPYLDATTRDIQRFYYGRELTSADQVNPMGFAYPMHAIVLFAPIAPLSWPVARICFLILLPILTALSVLLWLRVVGLQLSRNQLAATVILSVCSWPSMWAIHQVQPTVIVAALAAAGCFFLKRGNAATAGVLFGVATIKPQLVGVLIVWLLLWACLQGTWRFLISFGLTLATLLACATWILPNWVASWRSASADYTVYRHLELDLQLVFGRWAGLAVAAVFSIVAVNILWRNRRCASHSREFGMMCALCLALTLCILPSERAMTYNHVLLFPACYILVWERQQTHYAAIARRIALGLVAWGFLAVYLGVLLEMLRGPSDFADALPFETLLLPTVILIALVYPLLNARWVPVSPTVESQPA